MNATIFPHHEKYRKKIKPYLNDEFKNIDVVIDTMKLDRDICLNLMGIRS